MYAFDVTLNLPFDQALARVTEVLAAHKLGIVSDVDVAGIMKKRLDKDIRPYRILGACAPLLALRVIEAEPAAGALLPCNVVVRGEAEDRTAVSFMDPVPVLGLAGNPAVSAVGNEAGALLRQVAAVLANG